MYELRMNISHHSFSSVEYLLDLSRKGNFTVKIQVPQAGMKLP